MNITFDPLNRDERSVVLALLGNLETPVVAHQAPPHIEVPTQQTLATLTDPPAAEEKPKRTRRTKEQIEAAKAETEVLPAKGAAVSDAITATIPPPAPLPPREPAPTAASAPAAEDLFGEEKKAEPAPAKTWTKDELRALLTGYAEKHGPDKARQVMRDHGKADKLSDIQPGFYAAVAAALGA